jgi:hypothetical protein
MTGASERIFACSAASLSRSGRPQSTIGLAGIHHQYLPHRPSLSCWK